MKKSIFILILYSVIFGFIIGNNVWAQCVAPTSCNNSEITGVSVSPTSVNIGQTITFRLTGDATMNYQENHPGVGNCTGGWGANFVFNQTCTAQTGGNYSWTMSWSHCNCSAEYCFSGTCTLNPAVPYTIIGPTSTPAPPTSTLAPSVIVPTTVQATYPPPPPMGTIYPVYPGVTVSVIQPQNTMTGDASANSIVQFIFNLLMTLGFIAALIWIMYGAIKWITSGGEKAGVEEARNHVVQAIIGLLILVLVWVIVTLVLAVLGLQPITALVIPTLM